MPLYEYQCGRCGRFERIRKFSDPPLTDCPTCGNPVQKLPSSPAIRFKGSGWYVTDYARKPEKDKGRLSDSKEKATSAAGSSESPTSKPAGTGASSDKTTPS